MTFAERRKGKLQRLKEKLDAERERMEESGFCGGYGRTYISQIAYLQQQLRRVRGTLGNAKHRISIMKGVIENQEQEIGYLRQQIAVLRKAA